MCNCSRNHQRGATQPPSQARSKARLSCRHAQDCCYWCTPSSAETRGCGVEVLARSSITARRAPAFSEAVGAFSHVRFEPPPNPGELRPTLGIASNRVRSHTGLRAPRSHQPSRATADNARHRPAPGGRTGGVVALEAGCSRRGIQSWLARQRQPLRCEGPQRARCAWIKARATASPWVCNCWRRAGSSSGCAAVHDRAPTTHRIGRWRTQAVQAALAAPLIRAAFVGRPIEWSRPRPRLPARAGRRPAPRCGRFRDVPVQDRTRVPPRRCGAPSRDWHHAPARAGRRRHPLQQPVAAPVPDAIQPSRLASWRRND